MLYAIVGGTRERARRGRTGICPACGGEVVAKCGALRVWHWAHKSLADCDTWSEPVGPWHLSWQQLVRPEFVEVARGPHRADILGEGDKVIELQHSPISPEEIGEREEFYDDMLWLFDATCRFWGVRSGDRFFFSFGRTRHLEACAKPVCLDFGECVVEVETLTRALGGFSGFGRLRDRRWFTAEFLGQHCRPGAATGQLPPRSTAPNWPGGQPWRLTEHASRWIEPGSGRPVIYPRGTLFIPLAVYGNGTKLRGFGKWTDVVFRDLELANGWRPDELFLIHEFLGGTVMILEGRLRLMPPPAGRMQVACTVRSVEQMLDRVEPYIRAGRIAVLKNETRQLLLRQAGRFEEDRFGGRLGFPQYRQGGAS